MPSNLGATGETIAAVATPPGQGAVAIVRLSGPDARRIAAALFRRAGGGGIDEPRRVYLGQLHRAPGGAVVDQVLAFAMPGPDSYTGEDVVEIQCHGGSVVTAAVLESVLAAGARPAAPGEFTRRAFLNGRLDLAQAEAVADLVGAHSEAGRQLAWSQLEGVLSARVQALRAALVDARALCEAAIDFPDEDVPELGEGVVGRELGRVRAELERMAASFERARVRYEGARIALVGKPNVGKSSLLNALVGRDHAIVTAVAGTTRDVVEARTALGGLPVVLADTAGLRAARDPVEEIGVARTRGALDVSAAALVVLDGAAPLDAEDRTVARAVAGRPAVVALNKRDLAARVTRDEARALVPGATVVEASALTGAGVAAVAEAVARCLADEPDAARAAEVVLFRARHRDAARRAIEQLARAERALADGAPPELVASDLAAAADALDAITGAVTSEDVLDQVFARFCIGK